MLVVFSPIFVADTKIIFGYDFVAALNGTLPVAAFSVRKIFKKMR